MTQNNLTAFAPAPGDRLLVVGGCGGIGRCLVKTALNYDLEVAVFDLKSSLQANPLPTGVLSWEVDATDRENMDYAMQELQHKWQYLNGLVNLAGYMGEKHPLENFPEDAWDAVFDASYRSTLNSCRAALPLLNQSESTASIVNMSSGLANVCNPGYGPYSSAKAAIVALTKTIAKESAPNIRCNAVSPGGINTAFLTGGTGREQTAARISPEEYAKLVPLARLGEPEDVVGPILFLLSQSACYMTGQTLNIDGGALMP
jgi:3-oxoacyl-[acyl-carrier protein] reductase